MITGFGLEILPIGPSCFLAGWVLLGNSVEFWEPSLSPKARKAMRRGKSMYSSSIFQIQQ